MALNQTWALIVAIVVIIVAIGIGAAWALRRSGQRGTTRDPLARADRVRYLPSFQRSVRRRAAALAGILAVGVVGMVLAGVIAARPMTAQTIHPQNTNRDVMLCLDVSGSMSDVDSEVLEIFDDLIDGFEGERIGLTIFNSSPVQVFPLTDDYMFVREHLRSMRESFNYNDAVPEHWVGTMNGPGGSLIGDGLAACAMRFDHTDKERARSIVFATDNELNGVEVVSLDEAATFAEQQGIRVYSINPVDGKDTTQSEELRSAAERTGGKAYALRDTTTVSDIISEVEQQETALLRGEPRVVWSDAPELWIAALLVVMAGFTALVWRVRL